MYNSTLEWNDYGKNEDEYTEGKMVEVTEDTLVNNLHHEHQLLKVIPPLWDNKDLHREVVALREQGDCAKTQKQQKTNKDKEQS